MKLITEQMGKFLVVAVATVLVPVLVVSIVVPAIQNFSSTVFVGDTNYYDSKESVTAPRLSCENTEVEVPIGSSVDVFDGISAKSGSGEDLLGQLQADYAKSVGSRECVFVYKINDDRPNTLVSAIDTSAAGEWAVFYLLADGDEHATLEVRYFVS